ncbi:AraC family transcriptional regulator [SAR92 clade bacterium H455]|uniref:AraC family transcriptional regulator n=1 Tax=SAR92 clade bacterium H455 TaxID=2974818 RepID=A0ABY5TPZ1_9GAMM|nr:AraC family transcriptional regulator [SAR92 clade bacterium H455]
MVDINVAASTFNRLIDYIENIGLDIDAIAAAADVDVARLALLDDDTPLSSIKYSALYRELVKAMQKTNPHIPWGGGLGTESFEMMCYALMGCATLGEALDRAQRFEEMMRPLTGRQLRLEVGTDQASLHYSFDTQNVSALFVPPSWKLASTFDTVTMASGLLVWHAFCGWLTGHSIQATRVEVARPSIGSSYACNMEEMLGCPITFSAAANRIVFPRDTLELRVVQNTASLQPFLDTTVFQLSMIERQPSSAAEAIKQLIGFDFKTGVPSFSEIAHRLHMSESSLRRRLLKEKISYQLIKDEVRCKLAIDCLGDASRKINDIADELGFTEPSSFVRSFRHWTGHTPKAYRQNILKLKTTDAA